MYAYVKGYIRRAGNMKDDSNKCLVWCRWLAFGFATFGLGFILCLFTTGGAHCSADCCCFNETIVINSSTQCEDPVIITNQTTAQPLAPHSTTRDPFLKTGDMERWLQTYNELNLIPEAEPSLTSIWVHGIRPCPPHTPCAYFQPLAPQWKCMDEISRCPLGTHLVAVASELVNKTVKQCIGKDLKEFCKFVNATVKDDLQCKCIVI